VLRVPPLGALGERQFRRYFVGQATSYLGDGLLPVAISFAVLDLTGSASDLGLVLAARMVPVVAFLLVGGVWADRLPRHLVMVASDVVRGGAQAVLAVLLLTGRAELWHLLVLSALYGAAEAFWRPASTGLLPTVVSPGRLQQANALMAVTVNLAYVVGPAIAGVLVAGAGAGTAIAVDAATFAVSTAALLGLQVPAVARTARVTSFAAELKEGWGEFVSRTWLWVMVAFFALFLLVVTAPLMVLGPAVADRNLGGAGPWGAIAAAIGIGTIAGSALAARVRPRRPMLVTALLLAGTGLTPAALALLLPMPAIAAFGFLAGAAEGFMEVIWITRMQERVPQAALSRVSAYDTVGSFVFMPIGLALAGPVAAAAGTRATLLGAAAFAVASAVAAALVPSVRDLRRLDEQPVDALASLP